MSNELENDVATESVYHEKVRHRAYALWLRYGQQPGNDQEYWFEAEREIAEEEGRSDLSAANIPSSVEPD
jgi:hypothetical protein